MFHVGKVSKKRQIDRQREREREREEEEEASDISVDDSDNDPDYIANKDDVDTSLSKRQGG